MNKVKTKRIASDMMRHISDILANQAADHLFKSVTITAVDLAPDLSYAKVYFTSLAEEKEITKELNNAASFIRTKLAEVMNLRHTPMLNFTYDFSIDYGNKIEKILDEIHQKENQ